MIKPLNLQPTNYGKNQIALHMCDKGKSFIGSAILLRERGGHEYVVLHLLCQGIEVLGKGYLLKVNYDFYEKKLRSLGHNLIKLVEEIEKVSGLSILNKKIENEIIILNSLYSKHLLRYASMRDVIFDPKSVSSKRVFRRLVIVIKLAIKSGNLK